MNSINLGNMEIPVIKPKKGVDYYTEAEKEELIEETTTKVNQIIEPKETERQANEKIRKSNEEDRKNQENTRIDNENERQSNESTRQSNEITRQTNEQSRIEAEQSRNTAFTTQMTENEKAIQNVKDKTEEYNSNAEIKTNEFNLNAEQKTQTFNENANTKLQEINQIKDTTEAEIAVINEKDATQDTKIGALELDNKTNKQDISELKQKNTEQDTTIEELKAENIELKAENKRLNNDINAISVTERAEGENITLNDTAEARFKKFVPGGNSWQETRSGKNKSKNSELKLGNKINSSQTSNNYIEIDMLEVGKTYILSFKSTESKSGLTANVFNADFSQSVGLGVFNISSNLYSLTFTFTQEMLDCLTENQTITLWNSNGRFTTSSEVMLRENTTTEDYEPYGAMPSTEFESPIQNVTGNANVTVCNKNLFDINDLSTDYFEINDNEFKIKDDVNPSKKYYWYNNIHYSGNITFKWKFKVYDTSQPSSARGLVFRIYKTDGTYVELGSYVNTNDERQVTVDNVDYAYITYGNTHNNTIYDFEIVVGSPTNYVEHKEQSFTFPLQEGQRLMKGDYLADDGIHHKGGRYVFTGDETNVDKKWEDEAHIFIFKGLVSYLEDTSNLQLVGCKCNKYECTRYDGGKGSMWGEKFTNRDLFAITYKLSKTSIDHSGVLIKDNRFSTIEELLDNLKEQYNNGTPVYFEYILAEEEIEAYTPEQQAVYNEIKKTAHSYGEQTHIFCTDETSLIFSVEARKDMNTLVTRIEKLESEV